MDRVKRRLKRLDRSCTFSFMANLEATNRQLDKIRVTENERDRLRLAQGPPLAMRATGTLPPIGGGRRSAMEFHAGSTQQTLMPRKRSVTRWQPHKGDDDKDGDVVKKMKDKCSGARSLRIRVAESMTAQQDSREVLVKKVAQRTKLSHRKVEDLHRLFTKSNRKAKSLEPVAFVKVMSEFGIEDTAILERLYDIFDAGGDKSMSFEEFCDCMAVFLIGKRNKQAKVLFKMMDITGDGCVSKLEMLRFFAGAETSRDKKRILGALVSELMTLIDEDGSGEITYEEWVKKVSEDDSVWEIFTAISPLTVFIESVRKAGKYILPY